MDALFHLGQSLNQRMRYQDAAKVLEKAVSNKSANARVWCALGVSRRQMADMPAARNAYERALSIDPNYAAALVNLGEWHLMSGDATSALTYFDKVLANDPMHYEALTNKAAALNEASFRLEAVNLAIKTLQLFPQSIVLHVILGNICTAQAKPREAAEAYRKALVLDPNSEETAVSLAILLGSAEMLVGNIEFLKRQILIRGESSDRLLCLASAMFVLKAYKESREICLRILTKHPEHVGTLFRLSNVEEALGDNEKSITIARRVIVLNPSLPGIHSNIPFSATHTDKLTRQEVFDLHLEWAKCHETPLLGLPLCKRFPLSDEGELKGRRLRVGYVSGDLYLHPVGSTILEIFRKHNKNRFETWCYSALTSPDDVTVKIRSYADHWEDCFFFTNRELAERIASDEIDILVDLSGHTGRNRLCVFAMRPAPIQVSWLGYFHSTGLSSIDYFITDPHSTPPNDGQFFSERPVYLPHFRFCYTPPNYTPEVGELPLKKAGFITFGSFNRLSKLTPTVVKTWSSILAAFPESRLLLKTSGLNEENGKETIGKLFFENGINRDRLDLRGISSHQEMFQQYGEMDIALDPFPFNGGMTTLEALWMGVPVITLRGNTVVSLQSTSMLINIGLPELIFDDIHAYIAGAIALARDPSHLEKLRHGIRRNMMDSPLCQPEVFTRELESLYSKMWQAWCSGTKLPSEIYPPANFTEDPGSICDTGGFGSMSLRMESI